jgi:hypothetical protein
MAHILEGDWRSFLVREGTPTPDGTFHIEVETNGDLRNSNHGTGIPIMGGVVSGGFFHQIFIHQPAPPRLYKGVLIINGPSQVLCGAGILDPSAFLENEGRMTEEDILRILTQQQDVWVATKP